MSHEKEHGHKSTFVFKLELIETNGIPFLNEGECEKWNFEVHDNIKEL